MWRQSRLLSERVASVIAEVGINHDGSIEEARWLVNSAAAAGVAGVKFQYRNVERAYAMGASQIGDEIVRREIERNFLSVESLTRLASTARDAGLLVGISFFSSEDVRDFPDLSDTFDFLKVPSVELGNEDLVDALLDFELPTLISTGAHNEAVIVEKLSRIAGVPWWMPFHCVSNYPTDPRNSNLRYIEHLKVLFPERAVGFSSHEKGWEWSLIALTLGASVVERHITRSSSQSGLDHSSSSSPEEFQRLVEFSQHVAVALGSGAPRLTNQGEILNAQNLGRTWYLTRQVAKGEVIGRNSLAYAAPRLGGCVSLSDFEGRVALRTVQAGEPAGHALLRPLRAEIDLVTFANAHRVGIPVRQRDLAELTEVLPVEVREFHLTFGDLDLPLGGYSPAESSCYSVHAPDYISSTALIDPFASSPDLQEASLAALHEVARIAAHLQEESGRWVPVVASFPTVGTLGRDHLAQLREFVDQFSAKWGVSLLPQWLPPFAWYFGGTYDTSGLNSIEEVAECQALDMPLCLDVAHLLMTCNYENFPLSQAVDQLLPLTRHIHLADASGVDSEGVALGTGSLLGSMEVSKLLSSGCRVILETWQGHLDGGAGFIRDLATLRYAVVAASA